VLRTGFGFAFFAVGGLATAVLVFPLARRGAATPEQAELATQRVVSRGFRVFLRLLEVLGLARIQVEGAERLVRPGPRIIVANHPTLIDVVALLAQIPECDCVVKREVFENVFQRGVVGGTGYIPSDRGQAVIDACAARLRRGRSLLLFPEGTRSPERGLGRFRRGAARLALETGVDLLPVAITCEPPTLMRGQRWWEVPDRRFHLSLRVEEPIAVAPFLAGGEPMGVAARKLTSALRERFEKRLAEAG
jgi:1-acyl-sn-glycerol-3-phosphate acyltransferase